MKSNKDLQINEFLCAQNIKRALVHFDDPELVRKYLSKALAELYS